MDFIKTLINGLSLGGIYAMIAIGYTMVYGIAKMLNFAHGDIIMVGGYILMVFIGFTASPIIALIIGGLFCALLGIIMEKVAYKPLRAASPLAVLITAIGISYLLQSIAQIIWGSGTKIVTIYNLGKITIGSLTLEVNTIVTLGCTILIMLGLTLFIKFTKIGRAMVAVSEDRGAAELMGINVNTIITITFGIGSFLACLACFFYLMRVPSLTPTFGSMPGIKAFTAAVIGGIGSLPGAMLGGVLLGIIECLSTAFPSLCPKLVEAMPFLAKLPNYTTAIEFAILIIILLVRPSGLLGKKRREKV